MKARAYKKRTTRRDEILRSIAVVLSGKTESSEKNKNVQDSVKKTS